MPGPLWWDEAEQWVDRLMVCPSFNNFLLQEAVTWDMASARVLDWYTRRNFDFLGINLLLATGAGQRRWALWYDRIGHFAAGFLPVEDPMPVGSLVELKGDGASPARVKALEEKILPWLDGPQGRSNCRPTSQERASPAPSTP